MPKRLFARARSFLEHHLPEQRLFLRTDSETRFVRLKPATQALALAGTSVVLAWTIVATAVILMDSIGSGNAREQAKREQLTYEQRLNAMSLERDLRAEEASAAQERFVIALEQVSKMQSTLLASEERRKELETGIGVIQSTLRRTMSERDAARSEHAELVAELNDKIEATAVSGTSPEEVAETLQYVTDALNMTAGERDEMAAAADAALHEADRVAMDMKLLQERDNEIFNHLEEAVAISLEPLDKMFKSAGLDPNQLIKQIQRGYSGQGGPLGPLAPSITNDTSDPSAARASGILKSLDRMNMYRIAVEKTPFSMPVQTAFRYTSGYGRRWGRMHEGIDMAGAHGSPILATADGTVLYAGWKSGYGNVVQIRHEFGIETRYGHMSKIRVKTGQKVSRGDRIGDMGNTGRSTGTHLHYEVRVGGSAINPMTYIKAANNVF